MLAVCLTCGRSQDVEAELPGSRVRCECGEMIEMAPAVADSAPEGPATYRAATDASHLRCPVCGGSCPPTRRECTFCGTHLAAVRCPACAELHFAGAKLCSQCGVTLREDPGGERSERQCPRCKVELVAVRMADLDLDECARCAGIFVDHAALEKVTVDPQRRADLREAVGVIPRQSIPTAEKIDPIRYIHCPACGQMMNRRNFARVSGVIVDVCRVHGTWFDAGELTRAVEFVAAGGLARTRARETEEKKYIEREKQSQALRAAMSNPTQSSAALDYRQRTSLLQEVLSFVADLFIGH